MAITAPTTLESLGITLTPEQAAPIFEAARSESVVQRLARRIPMGPSGVSVPVSSSKPTAGWTAEGTKKHITESGIDFINLVPQKLTAIVVVSDEVIRSNPNGYVDSLYPELAEAFGRAFDLAALYGLGGDGTGTGPFAANIAETTKAVEIGTSADGAYFDIVAGLKQLADDGKKLTGFAFGDVAEPTFLAAKDGENRPMLQASTADGIYATIINRPMMLAEGAANGTTVGFGGDWTKAVWGEVGGINFKVSNESAVTINGALVSLFENNLVAIRAEAEYAFGVADVEHFVKFTDAA